jgi:prepilin-type N-terminal cleavage/methylation domain-containing protein
MRTRRSSRRRLTISRGARPFARRVARAAASPAIADQRGFTIVEVLVAASVLLIGLLGAVTMLDTASATDSTTKAREQGASLARELVEAGRSIPYAQLIPAAIVAKVQAMPNLGNANAGPGWTIRRRGVTYSVSIGACSVDDPSDGYGTEDPNFSCADNMGVPSTTCAQLLGRSGSVAGDPAVTAQNTGTLSGQRSIGDCGLDLSRDGRVDDLTQADASMCAQGACQNTPVGNDSSPDDYKRLVVLVAWSGTGVSGYVRVASLVVNPGQASGPSISAFGLQSNFNSSSSNPSTITDATIQSVPFSVTADSSAVAVRWSLNGTPQGSATNSGGAWSFSWPLGVTNSGTEVLDGNYVVTATPFDSNGNAGPTRSTTITLNRRRAYPPGSLAGGHDASFVDLLWSSNREGDILGYRAYRIVGSGQPDVLVCSTNNAKSNSCQDTNPPNTASIQYYVVALDNDPSGTVREGDPSTTLTVNNTNVAPNAPTGLQASPSNGNTVLLWTAPSPPDTDQDPIAFYRIYRDGQAVANRYDTSPGSASSYTDTATGGVAHTYRVTTVDPQLAESPATPPVTR